ncbi:MAG: HAMP domain-containing sensor histidine kinase [Kineosporiaceae bacterium]
MNAWPARWRRARTASRPPTRRRTWLTLRTRLTLAGLGLLVLAGTLLLALMNVLITVKLTSIYSRPLVMIDPESPASQFEQWRLAKQEANAWADEAAETIRLISLVAFAVVALFASAVYWLQAGRALRPLREITVVAGRLSQETLGERIAHTGPRDEVKLLADSFDAMLARLERAFDAQRLFVANASHELRGPLTIIRTAADLALSRPERPEEDYRKALDAVVAAAQRSQQLLDSLLRLASTQNRTGAIEPIDVADTVRAVLGGALPAGPELRTTLDPAPAHGDPVLVERLIHNLIDNAMRYTPGDGWVRVRTGTGTGDNAEVEVENTGRPVSATQVQRLRQPFHRGERTRSPDREGFGLGLAIAEAIVHAHGGHLTIVPREEGGLHITVVLPG